VSLVNKSVLRSVVAWLYSIRTGGLTVVAGFVLVMFLASLVLVRNKAQNDLIVQDRNPLGSGLTTNVDITQPELDSLVYLVAPGDSLWKVSERFLEDPGLYPEIARLNNLPVNARLEVGQKLVIPLDSSQDSTAVENEVKLEVKDELAENTYQVKSGDCLWSIAQNNLNDPYSWVEIYNLNKRVIGNNPGLILPGQTLVLPLIQ